MRQKTRPPSRTSRRINSLATVAVLVTAMVLSVAGPAGSFPAIFAPGFLEAVLLFLATLVLLLAARPAATPAGPAPRHRRDPESGRVLLEVQPPLPTPNVRGRRTMMGSPPIPRRAPAPHVRRRTHHCARPATRHRRPPAQKRCCINRGARMRGLGQWGSLADDVAVERVGRPLGRLRGPLDEPDGDRGLGAK